MSKEHSTGLQPGSRPGESVTGAGFVVLNENKFMNGHGIRSNSSFDAPYAEKEDAPYDTIQPRRVRRTEGGDTERLVKDTEGNFSWEVLDARVETHDQVLEEMAGALEQGERRDDRQDEEVEQLREVLASQDAKISSQEEEIAELRRMVAGLSIEKGEEGSSVVPTPGKEVELYVPPTKEVEPTNSEFSLEIPAELQAELEKGMTEYAKQTARARNGYLGHLLHNSKFWVKIPGMQRAADKVNRWSDKKLDAARAGYRQAVLDTQLEIHRQYEEWHGNEANSEEYENEVRTAKQIALLESNARLQEAIATERQERSGKAGWLTQQLTHKGSFKGKVAIAGTAAAIGVGVGLLGGGKVGGILAGGTAGGVMGYQVNRRRANSQTEQTTMEKDGTVRPLTLAELQSQEDQSGIYDTFGRKWDDESTADGTVEDIVAQVEGRTAAERQGNRSRLRTAIGIGAAAGGLGGGVGELFTGAVEATSVSDPIPTEQLPEIPSEEVALPPVAELVPDPSIGNYDYPWNWAAETFGPESATDTLKRLGELAAQDGHAISWQGSGVGEWVQVDGMSDTQSVLDILSRYTGRL